MNSILESANIVSFDDEPLILVNPKDRIIGHLEKIKVHQGQGHLHRAFSIFLFNQNSEVLLQRRGKEKHLWPDFWSNTCCSHPRKGESYKIATSRRLEDELGVRAKLSFIYQFLYRAKYKDVGIEHELCSVYVGLCESQIKPNPTEVSDHMWLSYHQLDRQIEAVPNKFTPWLKMEWQQLRGNKHVELLSVLGPHTPAN